MLRLLIVLTLVLLMKRSCWLSTVCIMLVLLHSIFPLKFSYKIVQCDSLSLSGYKTVYTEKEKGRSREVPSWKDTGDTEV